MAVTSWKQDSETIYIDVANTSSVTMTPSTTSISVPTTKSKYTSTIFSDRTSFTINNAILSYPSGSKRVSSGTSATVAKGTYATVPWSAISLTPGNVFTSSNRTSKTATGYLRLDTYSDVVAGTNIFYPPNTKTLVTYTFTLNAPPTTSYTQVTGNTGSGFYKGVTTAKVTISNLSAKYGGDFSNGGFCKLTIGNQTASRTTNGDLTIKLNATGTFTPTVSLKDSRGQTRTYNLNPITVVNAPVRAKHEGQWKYVMPRVKQNGSWKSVSRIFIKQNGTWRRFL